MQHHDGDAGSRVEGRAPTHQFTHQRARRHAGDGAERDAGKNERGRAHRRPGHEAGAHGHADDPEAADADAEQATGR